MRGNTCWNTSWENKMKKRTVVSNCNKQRNNKSLQYSGQQPIWGKSFPRAELPSIIEISKESTHLLSEPRKPPHSNSPLPLTCSMWEPTSNKDVTSPNQRRRSRSGDVSGSYRNAYRTTVSINHQFYHSTTFFFYLDLQKLST